MRKKKAFFFLLAPFLAFIVFYALANAYYAPTLIPVSTTNTTTYPAYVSALVYTKALVIYTKPLAPFIPLAFVLAIIATVAIALLLVFRKH